MFQHMIIYSPVNGQFAVAQLLGFYSLAESSSCRCDVPLFSSPLICLIPLFPMSSLCLCTEAESTSHHHFNERLKHHQPSSITAYPQKLGGLGGLHCVAMTTLLNWYKRDRSSFVKTLSQRLFFCSSSWPFGYANP